MQLIQISEPSLNETVFGIDLGTTNSLIAVVNTAGKIEIFKDEYGRELLPSAFSYENNVKKTGYDVSINAIYSIKRLMGKSIKDLRKEYIFSDIESKSEKVIKVKCSKDKYLSPAEVSAEILKALCKRVKRSIGKKVRKAVITVPAYFDDLARNATKCAAKLAGIEVLRLINEPTAAALSYSIEKNNNSGIYAVYDLGGGTFDISILKLHQGVFQVLAVGGDTELGGDDFDHLLSSIVFDKYKKRSDLSKSTDSLLKRSNSEDFVEKSLMVKRSFAKLRAAKEFLSKNSFGTFEFNINDELFKCKITRREFEQVIDPLVNKAINIVIRTIEDIGLKISDIKGVILVGGSTRVPLIHGSLVKLFGEEKVLSDVDPEKAVVIGAALHAYYLVSSDSKDKNVLLDVLPLSLGIETMGGVVEKIIQRNTPLPVSEIREFTTYVDGQTVMKIHVCQGEREMIKDNKSLAQFELRDIPPMPAGCARVEIEFLVSADGILTVTAREKTTGIEQVVEIDSSFGLSKADINHMVHQSINKFDEDMRARSLAEAKINGNKLICLIEGNSNSVANARLEKLLRDAKKTLQGDSLNKINKAITLLYNYSLELKMADKKNN